MVNIKHLRAFAAVATELHFTRAAEVVCITQPALSALIQQLEKDTGVRLLHRDTRRVELTEVGTEFHETVKKLLHDFDEAISDLQTYQSIKRGRINIAVLPSLCASLLPAVLQSFQKTYPDIRLNVFDISGQEIVTALQHKLIDFGLTYFHSTQNISAQSLMRDTLVLVCHRDWALSHQKSIKWSQLAGQQFIAMAQGTTIRTLIDKAATSRNLHLNVVLEPKLMPTALAYVEAGLGITVLPSSGVLIDLPAALKCVPLTTPIVKRELSILTLKNYTLTPAANALRKAILHNIYTTLARSGDRSY